MPSSVVHAAVAVLLAVGFLGGYYDRRALVVLFAVVVAPEADTLAGWVVDGAHRTLLHNAVFPAAATVALYWDTRLREASGLRERFGDYGVRVAWVALLVHAFAHVALDWTHLEGVNLLWPLHDQFFQLQGEASLSTTDGFVQTFVERAEDPGTGGASVDLGGGEGRQETHVANPVRPTADPAPEEPVDRRFPVAVRGWQLYLLGLGLFALVAKELQSPRPSRRDEQE